MIALAFVAGFFSGAFAGVMALVLVGNKIIKANLQQTLIDEKIAETRRRDAERRRQSTRSQML